MNKTHIQSAGLENKKIAYCISEQINALIKVLAIGVMLYFCGALIEKAFNVFDWDILTRSATAFIFLGMASEVTL